MLSDKIIIYNIFPNNYSSISNIIDKTQKIKEMKFNAICINPFHLANQTSKSKVIQNNIMRNLERNF